ncbi:hypothetical protein [Cesiribacter andamanensis]|uniref:Uncharacterized protein n=1 Tax=Cesiribacter andamanensis AMV16 TaxID=1279009 RepID=M7NHE6_9BACT|nr:hypothetical protein [Cesiribacter andamanensis]EMR01220.1 hypothetical protein ADICEAN_03651 [Cesiribacter andamanensis AMV16]
MRLRYMMRTILPLLLLFAFFTFAFWACQEPEKQKPSLAAEFPEQTSHDARLNLNNYILYKKLHKWNDNLYFLVMSWGTDSTGGYTILMADSTTGNYVSFAQHHQGGVVQSWINDFDRDSLPEIGIVTRSQNKRQSGQMRLHELSRNYTFETIDMQPLSEQLSADYEGGDIFYPQTGQVVREFRTVGFDSAAQEKIVRRIVYELDNNQLIVTEFENQLDESGDSPSKDEKEIEEQD